VAAAITGKAPKPEAVADNTDPKPKPKPSSASPSGLVPGIATSN
jgi:hypothetical protein